MGDADRMHSHLATDMRVPSCKTLLVVAENVAQGSFSLPLTPEMQLGLLLVARIKVALVARIK